jgi:hypothetical protein
LGFKKFCVSTSSPSIVPLVENGMSKPIARGLEHADAEIFVDSVDVGLVAAFPVRDVLRHSAVPHDRKSCPGIFVDSAGDFSISAGSITPLPWLLCNQQAEGRIAAKIKVDEVIVVNDQHRVRAGLLDLPAQDAKRLLPGDFRSIIFVFAGRVNNCRCECGAATAPT